MVVSSPYSPVSRRLRCVPTFNSRKLPFPDAREYDMKSSILSFLLLILLTLSMLAGATASPPTPLSQDISSSATASSPLAVPQTATEQPPLPGPNLAIVNWTSNRISDPSFEVWHDSLTLNDWSIEAPGDGAQWYATEPPWHISRGTYSMGIQCGAPNQHSSSAHVEQSMAADMSNLTLRLDWYLDQNLDPLHDSFHLHLEVADGGGNYYHLYYIFNGTTGEVNSTSYGYYLLHDPPHEWNTLNRNITADFVAIPAFPKTIGPSLKLAYIWFYAYASGSTKNVIRAFVDEVRLIDGVTTVIGDSIGNGNFETPDWTFWSSYGNRDASDARRSSTAHSGSWSLNMTAASAGNVSYACVYGGVEARLTSLNQGWLSFYWRLDQSNVGPVSTALITLGCSNATTSWFGLNYYLGYGGTNGLWGNVTGDLYLQADQFNSTGTWVAFHRNLWLDAAAYFRTSEITVEYLYFEVLTHVANSRVSLLVDDCTHVSGTINGAGFEDQGPPGSALRGWGFTGSAFTVTNTAYAGSKAANLTLPAGSPSWSNLQRLGPRPLNASRETYLDLMWQLQDYTPYPNSYAYVELQLGDGHTLGYYLAFTGSPPWTNNSANAWFSAVGVNTPGTWIQMHRDLAHDYQAAFGPLPDTTIEYLLMGAISGVQPRLVLLLDDFYLYDDPAPRISEVERWPTIPDNLQIVKVTAIIVDQDLIHGRLHYRFSSGAWEHVSMTPMGSDVYEASIPGQPHNTLVEYYLTADDAWGKTTTALNGDVYWAYTIPAATTTTTTGPPIPGFPWAGILLACAAALSLSFLRRRHRR